MSAPTWPSYLPAETRIRQGICPIEWKSGLAQDSNPPQAHSTDPNDGIYFELHGSGSEKILFIMGLSTTCYAWSDQVKYFATTNKHSVLVYDNRGVGYSSYPPGPYLTSNMADDARQLLDYVGWTSDVHVVGVSMGGMIAQHLAAQIPDRILSLSLCSTKPGGNDWMTAPPLSGIILYLQALLEQDPEKKLQATLRVVFPAAWLQETSQIDPSKTNMDIRVLITLARLAYQLPQRPEGQMLHVLATLLHYVSPEVHAMINSAIPKIFIVTGDKDDLIYPANSLELQKRMPKSEYQLWSGLGHAVHEQDPIRFNTNIARVIEEGRVDKNS